MGGWARRLSDAKQRLGEMGFIAGGGVVNWFPGHMAAATRAIRDRLKLVDLVIEVRDARIPLSSANMDLQSTLSGKRRIIALNKKDLANPNIMHRWIQYFERSKQDSLSINAHSRSSVNELLTLVELKLKEIICSEPTLLVMVVGIPNVGKSALINSIHRIAASLFPAQGKIKRATVGPLPGVTQDIAGYKIASRPSIYVLDTPGVLVPSIPDIEAGLKLALTGAVKDSVVGEDRLAKYFLAVLNHRKTPLHWKKLDNEQRDRPPSDTATRDKNVFRDSLPRRKMQPNDADVRYVEGFAREVQRTLYTTFSSFGGDVAEDGDLECLVDAQLEALAELFKVSARSAEEARTVVSKRLISLFRSGKLGPFVLDDVPELHPDPHH